MEIIQEYWKEIIIATICVVGVLMATYSPHDEELEEKEL